MSCCTTVHDVEGKNDQLLKYMEDYDNDADNESVTKQHDLLIEILETFRNGNNFRTNISID